MLIHYIDRFADRIFLSRHGAGCIFFSHGNISMNPKISLGCLSLVLLASGTSLGSQSADRELH